MYLGILLVVAAIIMYVLTVYFKSYYIEKFAPGLLEADSLLPPDKNGEYLWEKTAGLGIVPKWVSVLGLLSIPTFIAGIICVILL